MTHAMSNSQIKKRAAKLHNEKRAIQLALEKDRKENPEKYKRVSSVRKSRKVQAFITTAMALSASLPSYAMGNINKR